MTTTQCHDDGAADCDTCGYESATVAAETLQGAIYQFLESLGDNSTTVGWALLRRGVRGIPGQGAECLIAEAVNQEFPGVHAVVDMEYLTIRTNADALSAETVELPAPVEELVRDFDKGLWMELERRRP